MTRPPDYDLGTVEGIVRTVERLDWASGQAASWMEAGNCHPGTSKANPCRERACIARDARYAGDWATEAAHHARRLQGVAELADIVGFDAWFARWGDDCGR